MSEKKRIRDLKEALNSLLNEKLQITVQENRDQFLSDLIGTLERLHTRSLAIGKGSDLLHVIHDELQKLRGLIEEHKKINIADIYVNRVKRDTLDLADNVVISQSEDRFEILAGDSAFVKFAKSLKKTVRSTGTYTRDFSNLLRKFLNKPTKAYQPWKQVIPFRRLTEYHLCKTEEIFKKSIDQDNRLVTFIITRIEEFLAEVYFERGLNNRGEDSLTSFEDLIQQMLEKVRNKRNELDEQVEEDFSAIREDLFYHLERAGTFERPASFYKADKVERKSNRLRTALLNYLEQWTETNLQLLDKTETVKEFLDFKQDLKDQSHNFIDKLKQFFESFLVKPIDSLGQDLSGIKNKLQDLEKRQERESAIYLINDSKDLLKKLVRDIRQKLDREIEETKLSQKANVFTEKALLKANSISEKVLFVHDLELVKTPPTLDYNMVEWRILLVRSLKEHIFNKLQPSQQHYEDFLVQISGDLEEALEIMEVNLESALELFESSEKQGNPFTIANEAIERTLTKLEGSSNAIREKHEKLKLTVFDGAENFAVNILHLIHNGDSKELQILDAKYKVKQKAQGWQIKAGARWARFQDSLALFRRFIWKKINENVSTVRKKLGFEQQEPEQVIKTDIATYLSETDAKVKELPYIYRRLFNFDMETDRRFYVAINQNFGNLKKAYESWEEDYPATFAVIGEKGAGKSTYLNYALNDLFTEREVKKIIIGGGYYSEVDFIQFMKSELELEGVDSVEEIITAIRNAKNKKIIVLEALQNFYLRNINGYSAIESLLYVISETKDSVFWIVSCSAYAWNFLNKAVSVGEYFSHNVRTDQLDEKQIESVIMNRHRSSGYELHFEPSVAQSKSRAYRKLMDQDESSHEYLKEAYFENLTKLSEGNASIAMIFWYCLPWQQLFSMML